MMTRYALRNAMIDALERVSNDTQTYYTLNHIPPDKLKELEDFLVRFLKDLGVEFTM